MKITLFQKFLALSLAFGLAAPQSAWALRQTGLEEQEAGGPLNYKRQLLAALAAPNLPTPAPAVASPLPPNRSLAAGLEGVEGDAARIFELNRPYNLFLDKFQRDILNQLLGNKFRTRKQYDLARRIIAQILEYSEARRRGEFRLESLSLIERVVLHSVIPVFSASDVSVSLIRSRIDADREHVLRILKDQMDDEGRLSQEAIEGIVKKQRGGKRLRSIKTLEKIHTKEEIEGWIRQAVPVVERVLQQEFPGLGIQPRPIASETLLRLTILPLDQAEADEDSSVAAARPEEVERDAARILERSRPYNLFLDEFDSKSLDRLLKPTLRRDPKQYDLAGRIIAQILEYSEERRRGEFRLENLSLIERVVLHSVVPVLWKLDSSAPLIRSRIGADREHVLVILRGQMDDQRWLSQEAIERIVEKQRGSKQLTAIRALEEIHTKGEIEGWIRQAVPPVERALQRMFPELGIQPRPIAPETLLRLTILPLDRAGADEDASVAAGLEAGDPIVEGRLDEAAPAVLAPLLEQLSHPERKVLHMRFGLGGEERKHTLQEVGQHPDFRVSRERIRKIQWEALRKLAHWRTTQLEAEYLSEKPEAVRTRLSRPLDTLKLSIRSRKVVERALAPNRDFSRGITLRDLVLLKEEEILSAVEYPKTPFDDIRQKVQELGFRLGMHPDELPPPATEPLSGGSAQSGLEAGRRGEGDNGPSMLDVLMGFVLGVPVGAGLMYSVTERDRLAQPPARVIPQETPAVPQVAPAQPPAEEAPQESGLEVSAAGLWLDGYAAPDGRIVPDAWITSGLAAPGQSRLVLPISAGLDHGTHLYLQQGLLGEALVATLRLTPGVEVTEFMLSDIPEVDPSRNNVFVAAVQYDSPSEDRMRGYGSALVNLYGSSARRPWSPAVLATLVQAARQSDGLLRVGAVTADERVGLVSLGQAA